MASYNKSYIHGDNLLLTSQGYIQVKKLSIGDILYNGNREPFSINSINTVNTKREYHDVYFSSQNKISVSSNFKLMTHIKDNNNRGILSDKWMSVENIFYTLSSSPLESPIMGLLSGSLPMETSLIVSNSIIRDTFTDLSKGNIDIVKENSLMLWENSSLRKILSLVNKNGLPTHSLMELFKSGLSSGLFNANTLTSMKTSNIGCFSNIEESPYVTIGDISDVYSSEDNGYIINNGREDSIIINGVIGRF